MEQNRPSVKWFIETQAQWFIQNAIPEWFHGVITRKDAENLLKDKALGCFLIRVSESRIGYSLSYRTQDHYRHFMIDVFKDQQCIIKGDTTVHMTLNDLVTFYQRFPMRPYNEILTLPCGQKTSATADYEELFENRKTFATPFSVPSMAPMVDLAASNLTLQPACPPVPPRRQTPKTNSESMTNPCHLPPHQLPPHQPGNRLYPTLPTELQISNITDFVLPNTHPAITKSCSLDSTIPTAPLTTNCQFKKKEKPGHARVKPLKACRKAVTKAVSLVSEGEIANDLKKMENAMAMHLRSVKECFGQTGQRNENPTMQQINNHPTRPEEYKSPPPFAPGFC
ncbi:hematopoietic SH2 domain-containing protein [Pyxicephalus adspersus]|uniref:hematopoietic SH2 domain-containing protein n=1 Tax=Pyxicephalus adspersus TaxID=30357 RepID=UPI003B591B4C